MTTARRKITAQERRARLGARHLLAPAARAGTPEAVAEAVLGLHATDPASVYLAVAARLKDPSVAELERALYEDHTLVRMLCMRRTMFVVPRELAPVVDAAAARAVAARERKNLAKVIQEQLGFDDRWFAATEAAVLAALHESGEATASQLAEAVPDLKSQIVQSEGKPYEARPRITSRFLGVMAAEGRIRRGRPLGSWASSQYRWIPAEPHPELPLDEARARLAARYLASFGPATTEDVKWWTGWTLTDTRKALARTEAVEVDLDEGPGHALPAQLDAPAEPEPWAALLPALDPTPMGWRHRDWYFDAAHAPELFDTNGNIGPTVWWNGRVVGGWAQRADGEIVTELLVADGLGREARSAIAIEAERLASFFGEVRIKPSFRTPLERRLAS
ncbi:winged helix DNA-binding domain-containing protein [Streptomyces sp. ASQP_92]|uniref:winged helix DNA-binding domain-containing protein n=1 Tax=Streptomyces sp. ASQP_92 TaxID=2979116 RepID=UPI0021C16E75|nr:winged helix DNA-binding domain-containing protein [Streptomyces sp. ASQP_92]MCT9092279.1 winged helix DNA-binding domain-containing protein [Streptomyces sp. ASQP_92]